MLQPKSILKKTTASDTTTTLDIHPKSDAERKRLQVAIQHAHLIQEQKAILRANLDAIEELCEYPASSTPTEAETRAFLHYMTCFQPSDYDALIEERHVYDRCGYTLCANPPRKSNARAPWLRAKAALAWCSDDCAKRALYIKAQLDETPAWERRAGQDRNPIVLYGSANGALSSASSPQLELPVREKNHRDLAYERGEVKHIQDSRIDKVIKANVLENKFADSSIHNLIEGYQPRGNPRITTQGGASTVSFQVDSDED
jgi:hypothetical protein